MGESEGAGLLVEGFVLLGAALAFVLLFRRLGLGATLGYLVAGVVVGRRRRRRARERCDPGVDGG